MSILQYNTMSTITYAAVDQYPFDFVDALLGFLTQLLTTNSGGNMIMAAGVIPVLVQAVNNRTATGLKFVTRCIGLLDSVLYGFGNSFASFFEANGMDIMSARLKVNRGNVTNFQPADM
jgi:E3 ubiquitin-protein ligase HUWE1